MVHFGLGTGIAGALYCAFWALVPGTQIFGTLVSYLNGMCVDWQIEGHGFASRAPFFSFTFVPLDVRAIATYQWCYSFVAEFRCWLSRKLSYVKVFHGR